MAGCPITVYAGGLTLTVNITPAGAVYTDAALTTVATFPAAITTDTTWYVPPATGPYSVSAAYGGVELADASGIPAVVQASTPIALNPAGNLSAKSAEIADSAVYGVNEINGTAYGVRADGVTDDSAALQAAVNAAAAANGGVIRLPRGTLCLGTDIVINSSNIVIAGAGTVSGIFQATPTVGTILKRVGATAGDVVRFVTPAGSATAISGCGLESLSIVGNNTANTGLTLKSVQWSTFKNLHIRNCLVTAVDMLVEPDIADAVEDTQGNLFERVSITQTSSASGIGIRMDGVNPDGNTSVNSFNRISVLHTNGVGIQFKNADTNNMSSVLVVRAGGGTGIGVEFNGSSTLNAGHSRSNVIYGLDPGAGGVTARGTGLTQPSANNMIYTYSRENGAPAPVIESGATLNVFGDGGAPSTVSTSFIKDDFTAGSTGSTAIGELGWTSTNGALAVVTAPQDHPGVFNHSVTTASSVASLRLGGSNDCDLNPANFFDFTFIVRLNSVDTATDFRVGVTTAAGTAPPTGGIYIEKAFADTSWFGVARTGGVQTRTAALGAVSAGSWVRFRIRRRNTSTIAFSINGGAELTVASNVPTASMAFFTQISNSDGAAKNFDIDYFDCTYTGLNR